MLFQLAMKNLFRNKKRTFLTALSIFCASMIVIFGYGWVHGIIDNMFISYQNFQSGTCRIMRGDYVQQERFLPVDLFFENGDEIKEVLKNHLTAVFPKIRFEFEERLKFSGLAGKGEYSGPVLILGLNVESEGKRFGLQKNLVKGSSVVGKKEVIIGVMLAKNLHLGIGDSLLIATKTYVSGLNANKFIVKGIADFSVGTLNKTVVITNLDDAKHLLKIPGTAMTECLVFFKKNHLDIVRNEAKVFLSKRNENITVRTFIEDMGPMGRTFQMLSMILIIFFSIVVFLASFVIINSMMMNIFERINEIGTLKAQGMFDREIFGLHFFEGAIMGVLGGFPGTLAGFGASYYLSKKGVDMSAIFRNTNLFIESMIYMDASVSVLLICLGISLIIPAIATLLPSNYARKLNPVEALRKL